MFSNTDLEELLGWNDGTRVGIRSDALSSVTVQSHEALHGRIFNETADGHLHRLCCMAAGTPLDAQFSGVYTQAAQIMFEDTRLAHEAAATYLSIQGLPTQALRRSEYRKLASTYKDYYSLLDELVRPISPTTWLRFAFAWTFIHWCFQSKRFDYFFAIKRPSLKPFLEVPSPTERFIEAKRYLLADGRLLTWANDSLATASSAFSTQGFDLWDLQNEAEWDERAGQIELQAFENQLTSAAGDWLCENLPFESADFGTPRDSFGLGFDLLMKKLRLVPAPLYCGPESVLDAGFQDANLERLARAHSADVVEHRPSCPLLDLSKAAFAEAMGECLQAIAASTHVIILSHTDPDKLILLCRRSIEPATEGSFRYEAIGSFLIGKDIGPLVVHGRFAPGATGTREPELWIMLRTSRERMMDTLLQAFELCGGGGGEGANGEAAPHLLLPAERMQFYFDGPWADVYEMPGVRVTSLRVTLRDDPSSSEAKPLSVRIAAPPAGLAVLLIAAKPAWAGSTLDRYEKQRISEGSLAELKLPDADASQLMTPLMNAWHVWNRF